MNWRVLLLAAPVFLSGCSYLTGDDGYFRDRKDDYLEAKIIDPLKVPEGYDSAALDDIYVLPPDTRAEAKPTGEIPRPQPLIAGEFDQFVRLQTLSPNTWAVVELSTGEVWPRVRNFFEQNRVELYRADGKQGVLETSWLRFKTDESVMEKYRVTIEPGVQAKTAEVHVRQMSMPAEGSPDNMVEWPAVSNSEEREKWMVTEIANHIAQNTGRQSVSLLAQGISSASRVEVVKPDNADPYIALQLEFFRAWASMSLALRKAEFKVDDRNQSEGVYYVTYEPEVAEEDQPGFISRLFGATGLDEEQEALQHSYKVRLQRQEGNRVHIHLESDKAISRSGHEFLLNVIKGNIS